MVPWRAIVRWTRGVAVGLAVCVMVVGHGAALPRIALADNTFGITGAGDDCTPVDYSRWTHWTRGGYAGIVPNEDWQIAPGGNGVEVSSPVGDSGVSFAFASNPLGWGPDQVLGLALRGLGIANPAILDQAGPRQMNGFERTAYEITGYAYNGQIDGPLHAVVLADVNPSAYEAYALWAYTDAWVERCGTLETIREHLVAGVG